MSNATVKEHLGAEASRCCEFLPLYHKVATVTMVQFSYLQDAGTTLYIVSNTFKKCKYFKKEKKN